MRKNTVGGKVFIMKTPKWPSVINLKNATQPSSFPRRRESSASAEYSSQQFAQHCTGFPPKACGNDRAAIRRAAIRRAAIRRAAIRVFQAIVFSIDYTGTLMLY